MSYSNKNNSITRDSWLKEVFFTRRMNSVPGWIVMALVGIGLAYAGNEYGSKVPVMIAAAPAGFLFVMACFYYPEFAYYAFFASIFIFTLPYRLIGVNIPLGPAIEGLGYLSALSVIASQYRRRTSSKDFWRTPISLMFLLLFVFMLLEAFNPEVGGQGREGWFNFVRKQILFVIFYYISFLMLDSIEKIRRFVKIWILMLIVLAVWGIKQQYFGFSAPEMAWINSDPAIAGLLFQGGVFRKFSLLPDPAAFGVMATCGALFTLVLAIRSPVKKNRKKLYVISFIMILVSSYSGTRTCNVMLIAGLLFYILFTLNERRSVIVLLTSIGLGIFILFGPLRYTPLVYRISTTFNGSKDASNMVRDINRRNIQPYVYVHPLGGGLNTCGEEGRRFYPGHRLAGYPPDSGYMKIMLEQGWVGLALNLIFYFIILQRGMSGFYDSRRTEIKNLYMAFTVAFFSITVGQYSQLAISQYPMYLYYIVTLVILYKLKEYDTTKPEDHEQSFA